MNLLKTLTLSSLIFTFHCGVESPADEENFELEVQNTQVSETLLRSNDLVLNTGSLTSIAIQDDNDKFPLGQDELLSIAALGDLSLIHI